jgi:hypothetical protein
MMFELKLPLSVTSADGWKNGIFKFAKYDNYCTRPKEPIDSSSTICIPKLSTFNDEIAGFLCNN